MVHIVRLRTRKNRLFGQAKNGSIWMHNHQAWTAKQLDNMVSLANQAAHERNDFDTSPDTPQRYIDIDRQHWTKVRGAS